MSPAAFLINIRNQTADYEMARLKIAPDARETEALRL